MRPESVSQKMRRMERSYPFFRLLRPVGGVVQQPTLIPMRDLSVPDFSVFGSGLGYLTMISPHILLGDGKTVNDVSGAGSDDDPDQAIVRSVAEAAERYANCVFSPESVITASANELGVDALDLDTLPKCSARELADPKCPVKNPVKDQPIRWIKGVSLTRHGAPVHIPLMLTHLYVAPGPAEQFSCPISTGVAVHTTLAKALVSAINEVIERDAIAITWLARLPLARIHIDCPIPEAHAVKFKRLDRSLLESQFFDATSDVGVPTVYNVNLLRAHPQVARFVSCSVEFSPFDACAKVIREGAASRCMFEDGLPVPADVNDFMSLCDGAAYLGKPERAGSFDFLARSQRRCSMSALQEQHAALAGFDDGERLNFLVARLRALGMEVAAADITTDELRLVGLRAVRVVIPQLMPMSNWQRARFLAHPRLYDYPKAAGYGSLSEADVNPDPQPFA
jgi:ribosomal protein S12 methylthiotransferase accessory factor